jgi:hypothetical protein
MSTIQTYKNPSYIVDFPFVRILITLGLDLQGNVTRCQQQTYLTPGTYHFLRLLLRVHKIGW